MVSGQRGVFSGLHLFLAVERVAAPGVGDTLSTNVTGEVPPNSMVEALT